MWQLKETKQWLGIKSFTTAVHITLVVIMFLCVFHFVFFSSEFLLTK